MLFLFNKYKFLFVLLFQLAFTIIFSIICDSAFCLEDSNANKLTLERVEDLLRIIELEQRHSEIEEQIANQTSKEQNPTDFYFGLSAFVAVISFVCSYQSGIAPDAGTIGSVMESASLLSQVDTSALTPEAPVANMSNYAVYFKDRDGTQRFFSTLKEYTDYIDRPVPVQVESIPLKNIKHTSSWLDSIWYFFGYNTTK